eukprot:scaffold56259_cov64-Phaeocystis_antarctica.AAC.3
MEPQTAAKEAASGSAPSAPASDRSSPRTRWMRWTGGRAAAWSASLMRLGLRLRSGACRRSGGGRGGWRCDRRRRRRGGGRGAARRRAGVRLRSGAAPCAPRVASLVLPPPSGFAAPVPWLAPSLHSCDAGTIPPCA